MDEARAFFAPGAIANGCASRLVIANARDGGHLQPFTAARGPGLDIEADMGGLAGVAGALKHQAVWQPEPLAGGFGIRHHLLELSDGILRRAKFIHLNLVELVAAFDAAHVAAGAHLLSAETRRIRRVASRQISFIEDLAHMQARERHFSGGDHVQVFFVILVEVVSEARKLPGAIQCFRAHHKGSVFFRIALANMEVKHPRDNGALQASTGTAEHIEARAGKSHTLVEVDNAELRAQVPVRLGLEIEVGFIAPLLHHQVGFLASGRDTVFHEIGQGCHQFVKLFVYAGKLCIQSVDLIPDGAHGGNFFFANRLIFAGANLPGSFVALRLQCFDVHQQFAAPGIQAAGFVDQRRIHVALDHACFDQIGLFANEFDVDHASS